jgi:dihydrofolate reductase
VLGMLSIGPFLLPAVLVFLLVAIAVTRQGPGRSLIQGITVAGTAALTQFALMVLILRPHVSAPPPPASGRPRSEALARRCRYGRPPFVSTVDPQLVITKRRAKTMRNIHVLTFLSLDGVMQGPGGPEEDSSGEFTRGGWTVGYFDEAVGEEMTRQMDRPFDLLLGRRTYEIFASYWPEAEVPGAELINNATKYVATHRPLTKGWNTVRLEDDVVEAIRRLKSEPGPELQVHGSQTLIQTLLANDLVDELWLKTFPVTVGSGRRLFAEGTPYAGFELVDCSTSPSGVVMARYRRAGDVKSGTFLTEG